MARLDGRRRRLPHVTLKIGALNMAFTAMDATEEPKPHNALTGAKSHAEVISRLLYDKKLLPEFEQFEIPWL